MFGYIRRKKKRNKEKVKVQNENNSSPFIGGYHNYWRDYRSQEELDIVRHAQYYA